MLCLYIRLFKCTSVPSWAACVLENPPKLATASTTYKGILYPFYATLPKAF
uniref:Uncharacterized protein n=1 Tax=virus sp. ctCsQ3 TaxID=2826794 RepID=A0A8S5R6X2_9VIRU|nr:MAG TPA: hypothetical protein [virus sp. ctCsQ3]